jgi:hypothetical protein
MRHLCLVESLALLALTGLALGPVAVIGMALVMLGVIVREPRAD